jgi:hypothetical protein
VDAVSEAGALVDGFLALVGLKARPDALSRLMTIFRPGSRACRCLAASAHGVRPATVSMFNADEYDTNNAEISIESVQRFNKVDRVEIIDPGEGYADPPTVVFEAAIPGPTATGTAALDAGGRVAGVELTEHGWYDAMCPAVRFEGPCTRPATGRVVMGLVLRSGVSVTMFTQPDQGESACFFGRATGGGTGAAIYKLNWRLRPDGWEDWVRSPQGAAEFGTTDASFAVLAVAGMWGSPIMSNAYVATLGARGKGHLVQPEDGVFDNRRAFEIGTHQLDAPNVNQTLWMELNGSMMVTRLFFPSGGQLYADDAGTLWYLGPRGTATPLARP